MTVTDTNTNSTGVGRDGLGWCRAREPNTHRPAPVQPPLVLHQLPCSTPTQPPSSPNADQGRAQATTHRRGQRAQQGGGAGNKGQWFRLGRYTIAGTLLAATGNYTMICVCVYGCWMYVCIYLCECVNIFGNKLCVWICV